MKQWINSHNRLNQFVISILVLLLLSGCLNSGTDKNDKPIKGDKSSSGPIIYKKPSTGINDTLIIKDQSAVFYTPDSLQLKKIKAITENMVYESSIHDCFYQMRNARIVLKRYWPLINIIETSNARYLEFMKTDKSKSYIDLETKGDMCGVFLFDGQKNPEPVDMMNIETALGFYFKK